MADQRDGRVVTGVLALLTASSPPGALLASASPPQSNAGGSGGGPFTCPSVTAIASGGVGPYAYAWTVIDSNYALTANSPAAATTGFTFSFVALEEPGVATARCTITDTFSGRTGTVDVPVSYTRFP